MRGSVPVSVAVGLVWLVLTVTANVFLVSIWRSPERATIFAERMQPAERAWGMRARSVAAGVLGADFLTLMFPLGAFTLLDGRGRWGAAWETVFMLLTTFSFFAMVICLVFIVTTARWGRPRWVVPPYLRDNWLIAIEGVLGV